MKPSEKSNKVSADHSFMGHRLLQQLAQEFDRFHANPEAFQPQRLEELTRSFFGELGTILQKSKTLQELKKNWEEPQGPSWGQWIRKSLQLVRGHEVDDYGLDREFELQIKPFFDFLFQKYFRVQVKGLEHIPAEGRRLVVSNHSGVLPYDAAMLKVALFNEHPAKRELRFLVDDFVFHFPFLGVVMNRIGGVRACPENAERLLNAEEMIAVFPEGIKGIGKKFSDRYRLQRFGRGGVIRLAFKTRSPITPVAVIGAEEIHPLLYKSTMLARPLGLPFIPITPTFPWLGPLGMIPLPTQWSIQFGPSLSFEGISAKDVNDGILINRETEKLRATIQTMITEELKNRRSVF
jgi:1-acyl-sn-glycerol-3-phosphate acyltransferase